MLGLFGCDGFEKVLNERTVLIGRIDRLGDERRMPGYAKRCGDAVGLPRRADCSFHTAAENSQTRQWMDIRFAHPQCGRHVCHSRSRGRFEELVGSATIGSVCNARGRKSCAPQHDFDRIVVIIYPERGLRARRELHNVAAPGGRKDEGRAARCCQ